MLTMDGLASFAIIGIVTIMIILKDKNKLAKFIKLFSNPAIIINISVVMIFSYFMLYSGDNTKEGKRRKESTKQALLGLLIALMAHIDMKIAPFWLIWCASYYLNA